MASLAVVDLKKRKSETDLSDQREKKSKVLDVVKVDAMVQSTCFGDGNDQNDCLLKIEVKAKRNDFKVNKVNLILALDISGSMEGTKLDRAIKTLCAVVRTLKQNATTNDIQHYFTLFGFDDQIHSYDLENHAIGKDTNIETLISRLKRICAEGSTNIEKAFVHAFDILEKQDDDIVNGRDTVIALLSDGSPNQGIRNGSHMAQAIQTMRSKYQKPIKLSVIGYGNDYSADFCHSLIEPDVNDEIFHVNPEEHESLINASGGILGGAMATVVQNLRIRILHGIDLIKVHHVYGANGKALSKCLVFGHLENGQSKNVVVCCKKEKEITLDVSYICKTDDGTMKKMQKKVIMNNNEKNEDVTTCFFKNKCALLKKKCLDVMFSNANAFKEAIDKLQTFLSNMKNNVDEVIWKNVEESVKEMNETFLNGQRSYANHARNNLMRATSLRLTRQNADSNLRRALSTNIANHFAGNSLSSIPSIEMQQNNSSGSIFDLLGLGDDVVHNESLFAGRSGTIGLRRSMTMPQ